MMRPNLIKESEMVEEFLNQFSSVFLFVREVPVFAKSVDLVKLDIANQKITAIEFKTTKWRKAELQVLGSASAFDYLEICILKPTTQKCRDVIINECQEQGIGLYLMDSATHIIEHPVEPVSHDTFWEIQRNQVLEYVSRRANNGYNIQINKI